MHRPGKAARRWSDRSNWGASRSASPARPLRLQPKMTRRKFNIRERRRGLSYRQLKKLSC